jgi:hypothetical protein
MSELMDRNQAILVIEGSFEVALKQLAAATARNTRYADSHCQIATPDSTEVLDILQLNHKILRFTRSIILEMSSFIVKPRVVEMVESHHLDNLKLRLANVLGNIDVITKEQARVLQEYSIAVSDSKLPQKDQHASNALVQASSQRLVVIRKQIQEEKRTWRWETRPLWRIPTEIWEVIFLLVLWGERHDYLKIYTTEPLRSISLTLSHVCSYWKLIVQNEPRLSTLVYGPPLRSWLLHEYDQLTESINRTTSPITVLTNLSQVFPGGYYIVKRRNASGRLADVKTMSQMDIFGDREFELHIYRPRKGSDDRWNGIPVPFRAAKTLTITMGMHPPITGPIFSKLSLFKSLKSLTITSDYPGGVWASMYLNIRRYLPLLTVLKFLLKQIPHQFKLEEAISRPLEEFYLYHETKEPHLHRLRSYLYYDLTSQRNPFVLPSLHTLGSLLPDLWVYNSIEFTTLESLVLYGSSFHFDFHMDDIENLDNIFRRLSNIRFESWKEHESPEQLHRVVPVLEIFTRKCPSLKSIKISDSFVDGAALVALFKEVGNSPKRDRLRRLEVLTLSFTSGITRTQCDELSLLVPKLNVHV